MSTVEPGTPHDAPPPPMDVDRALVVLSGPVPALDDLEHYDEYERAQDALRRLHSCARAYVRGRTVGRFVALAGALHEPVASPDESEPTDAQVERYLKARGQLRITHEAAARLGLITGPT